LRDEAEKESFEPTLTGSVLVMLRGTLAVIPVSHPEMKGPAIANTSSGVRAISKAWGMALPDPLRMFKIL
jgi:hypothetical protein